MNPLAQEEMAAWGRVTGQCQHGGSCS